MLALRVFLFALFWVEAACGTEMIAGLTIATDVSDSMAIGRQLEAMKAALSEQPRDYSKAAAEFTKNVTAMLSLQQILACGSVRAPGCDSEPFASFAAYWGSEDYMNELVGSVLQGPTIWNLNDKAREELIMKSSVLEGVLMAAISHLAAAVEQACAGNSAAALELLEHAWALYASSPTEGPIRLAEKRAPQFNVEVSEPGASGKSIVNANLLKHFTSMQSKVTQADNCADMQKLSQQSVAQMRVPLIQGLLREAYEVDPANGGADGFIEVVEGWAFTRAILPAIANCSVTVATIIRTNMDTIHLGEAGPHIPAGYGVVKGQLESVYDCLGVSCADVNAMVHEETGELLWTPCGETAPTASYSPKAWSGPWSVCSVMAVILLIATERAGSSHSLLAH